MPFDATPSDALLRAFAWFLFLPEYEQKCPHRYPQVDNRKIKGKLEKNMTINNFIHIIHSFY